MSGIACILQYDHYKDNRNQSILVSREYHYKLSGKNAYQIIDIWGYLNPLTYYSIFDAYIWINFITQIWKLWYVREIMTD